ncbi:MAG: hypothetical protein IKA36_05610 [Clostridia bacterium]|nr:hypothetical protein [Clostridia bacterium]
MTKNIESKNNECTIHVIPQTISDSDINALFLGLVDVVKKKIELDYKSQFLNLSSDYVRIEKLLKEKTAECNRLKNEIVFLKSKLEP